MGYFRTLPEIEMRHARRCNRFQRMLFILLPAAVRA
jgi:hypothetical protein